MMLIIVSLITNLALAFGLFYLGVSESISFAVALAVTLFLNFSGCRWFVFFSTDVPVITQFIQFAITNGSFRLLEYLSLLVLSTLGFSNYYIRVLFPHFPDDFLRFGMRFAPDPLKQGYSAKSCHGDRGTQWVTRKRTICGSVLTAA